MDQRRLTEPTEVERFVDRLELMEDLDDLALGGAGGMATSVEILADGLTHGPDDVLDTFEPIRDLAEGNDQFDELF